MFLSLISSHRGPINAFCIHVGTCKSRFVWSYRILIFYFGQLMFWLKGRLNSSVVSQLDLIFGTLCHALGREFKPWWRQTLIRTQAQHLHFIHDSVWFVWFDTIICLSNFSCELWNRKLKIKEIYLKKFIFWLVRIFSGARIRTRDSPLLMLRLRPLG